MATKLYFRDLASDNDMTANLDKAMSLSPGGAKTTSVTSYAGAQKTVTNTSGGTTTIWWSPPLAPFTLSGTITLNFWGFEANMSANAEWRLTLNRADGDGNSIFQFVTAVNPFAEMGTTVAVQSATTSPTSTTFASGQRIRADLFVGPDTVISGGPYDVTFDYDGPTTAADGDSYLQFTETITLAAPFDQGVIDEVYKTSVNRSAVFCLGGKRARRGRLWLPTPAIT